MRIGLREKFIIFISILLVSLVTILTFINIKGQQKIIVDRMGDKAKAMALIFAENSADYIYLLKIRELRRFIDDALRHNEVIYAYVFDEDGTILTEGTSENKFRHQILQDPISKRAVGADSTLLQFEQDILDITEPVYLGSERIGGVRIGFSLKKMNDEIITVRNRNILYGMGFTLLGIFFTSVLARTITKPIANLIEGTKRISEGELDTRVNVHTSDELRDLADSFNHMARELKKSKGEIVSAKEYNDNILRYMNDSLIVINLDGFIETSNLSACLMSGYEEKELVDMPFENLFLNGASMKESVIEPILKIGFINNFEETFLTKEGDDLPVSLSGSVMYDSKKNFVGIVLVAQNITDRKRLENEIIKHQNLESLGVLAGGIAHDFNNFLTAILGNVSLALTYSNLEEETYKCLKEMEKASVLAKGLTEQLLTFAKGGAPIKQVTSIVDLLKESTDFALRGSNVKSEFQSADNLWKVEIDYGQISQVINNIVINAKQATPDGGVVSVKAENPVIENSDDLQLNDGKYVKISIIDNGHGIPKEYVHKIFDPYFTTKEEGSGLGLAACYSIVKKHNGYIRVDSTEGIGTTFSIFLPASQKQVDIYGNKSLIPPKGEGRILLMDDEENVRDVVSSMLEVLGYEVEVTKDGEEALRVYKSAMRSDKSFDAVILDLTVPGGMGGEETLRRLKDISPGVKAMASSGYANDPILSDFEKHGFSGALSKRVVGFSLVSTAWYRANNYRGLASNYKVLVDMDWDGF